jgi:hypothetical protein
MGGRAVVHARLARAAARRDSSRDLGPLTCPARTAALVGPLLAGRSAAWQLTDLQVMEVIERGDGNDDWKVYRVNRVNCPQPRAE